MVSIEWQGLETVTQALARVQRQMVPVVALALEQEAQRILEASQQLVPVATGALRASGAVEGPQMAGPQVTMTLRYGDYGRLPYAAAVEFRTDVSHPHGQAFYLSQPTFAAVGEMAQRLAAHIEGRMRR